MAVRAIPAYAESVSINAEGGQDAPPQPAKSLPFIEVKHVHDAVLAVNQQHPPVVNHALQVVRQLGQLVFAGQGQGLSLLLHFRR